MPTTTNQMGPWDGGSWSAFDWNPTTDRGQVNPSMAPSTYNSGGSYPDTGLPQQATGYFDPNGAFSAAGTPGQLQMGGMAGINGAFGQFGTDAQPGAIGNAFAAAGSPNAGMQQSLEQYIASIFGSQPTAATAAITAATGMPGGIGGDGPVASGGWSGGPSGGLSYDQAVSNSVRGAGSEVLNGVMNGGYGSLPAGYEYGYAWGAPNNIGINPTGYNDYYDDKYGPATTGSGLFGALASEFGGDTAGDSTSKIVCSAMNRQYGFGSYRNAVWMAYSAKFMTKAHERGYHRIFRPILNWSEGAKAGPRSAVWRALQHIARHRTADLRAVMKGRKRDRLGAMYRFVLEPTCYIVGKF